MERAWKRNEVAVSPVIATILLVAITVVLAAVLYVMVTPPPPPEFGTVRMTKDYVDYGTWEIRIVSSSTTEDLVDYKVVILKNQTNIHVMDPIEEVKTGDYRFTDLDGGGTLGAGDRFIIKCDSDSHYELSVIWKDTGDLRGSVEWET